MTQSGPNVSVGLCKHQTSDRLQPNTIESRNNQNFTMTLTTDTTTHIALHDNHYDDNNRAHIILDMDEMFCMFAFK